MCRGPVDRLMLKGVRLVAERVIPIQVGGVELLVETTPVAGLDLSYGPTPAG